MRRSIAVVVALGLVGAFGCDSGETKKAEPKSEPGKPDIKEVVAPPPDGKAAPEPPVPDDPPPT